MKPKVKVRVWAGRGKKPPARSAAQPQPASSSPQPQQGPQPKTSAQATRLSGTLLTTALLLGAIGLVGGGGWLALRLIINPASVKWLGALLPWGSSLAAPPQTWSELAAEVGQTGQALGAPLYFSTYPGLTRQQPGFYDLLLPVVRPLKHCPTAGQRSNQINQTNQTNQSARQSSSARPPAEPVKPGCSQITELRVYRPRPGLTYELLDRISVTGPEELFVVAPLARSSSATQGTSRTLPFTGVSFIATSGVTASAGASQPAASKDQAGIWLQLSGEWQRGSRVLYGQVVQYDPNRTRLFSFQNWSSPPGQFPTWQQVTGDSEPELVVNQSVGLEPQFQVLQLKPPRSIGQSVSLEAVTLTEMASNDRTYLNGLLLARNGLWSPALTLLKRAKPQLAKTRDWSGSAQAQLDLIRLHAQVTQAQANRDWASPTQQILADVTDGRWAEALAVLKQAHRSGYDVRNLLATNSDRLWQRVETALRVDAKPSDLQTWGTLILAVRQNQQQALLWLQKQPDAAKHLFKIQQTLAVLAAPDRPAAVLPSSRPQLAAATAANSLAGSPASPASSSISSPTPIALIGAVTPLATLAPQDWSSPAKSLASTLTITLPSTERWYRVALLAGTSDRAQLNRLVAEGAQLQVGVWQGANLIQTMPLTVRAMQNREGGLLLASGAALAADPKSTVLVALSADVSWLQPTAGLTLNELAQQPIWQTTLIPQLWQDLQTAQLVDPAADPLQTIGSWTLQTLELTGDRSPELILTIQPDRQLAQLQAQSQVQSQAQPDQLHTVIFSNQAQIYSDLKTPQRSLVAIAAPANRLPSLLIRQGLELQLWQWSGQTQKFEQK
jgi:hypothetical protein